MKNSAIREKYIALNTLAGRVLPSPSSVNKVSALLVRFKPLYEATELSRKQIIFVDHPLPPGYHEEEPPLGLTELRQAAVDALMELGSPVKKVPSVLRLTSADMPKVLSREGGESNAEGVATIRTLLGSLYTLTGDEIIAEESTDEEED